MYMLSSYSCGWWQFDSQVQPENLRRKCKSASSPIEPSSKQYLPTPSSLNQMSLHQMSLQIPPEVGGLVPMVRMDTVESLELISGDIESGSQWPFQGAQGATASDPWEARRKAASSQALGGSPKRGLWPTVPAWAGIMGLTHRKGELQLV